MSSHLGRGILKIHNKNCWISNDSISDINNINRRSISGISYSIRGDDDTIDIFRDIIIENTNHLEKPHSLFFNDFWWRDTC
jgi:hypothetical protein